MRQFRRALITGIGGSGGSYLAEYIAKHEPYVELHGISRWHSTTVNNLEGLIRKAVIHECDLLDLASIVRVLERVEPDVIFHLASYANVRTSFITPQVVMNNNVIGTVNLFEAIRLVKINPIIQLCSTSEVYGQVRQDEVPIKETAPLRPVNPYAVSKLTQDLMGHSYFHNYAMKIIRTRMFAYFNPRRQDIFSTSFARQVARIEKGLQSELTHGNLDSTRTLLDVRDAMRSYWEAALHCTPGEVYNIGGKVSIKVGDFLKKLIKLSSVKIKTRQDESLIRPTDVTLQIPDTKKFEKATGWLPQYTFQDSLEHLLDYWRHRF